MEPITLRPDAIRDRDQLRSFLELLNHLANGDTPVRVTVLIDLVLGSTRPLETIARSQPPSPGPRRSTTMSADGD